MPRILIVDLSGYLLDALREDEEFILYRARSAQPELPSFLLLTPSSSRPRVEILEKIDHEYSFKDDLDSSWALRPVERSIFKDKRALVLEDPGGTLLNRIIEGPMEVKRFLRLAVRISDAVGQLHRRGLIHKDVKPTNVLVAPDAGGAWLTGFGIASRLGRERQSPDAPESISGTLAYMAPEQTGRMNRSIDSRSDLYALGVTLYELLTGCLPFTASEPMEWAYSHIARQPVPPHERYGDVPLMVSAIVMKLLAKTPEERYQTAYGARSDLQHCLDEWQTAAAISDFRLGENDVPDRLMIPEKLYGRTFEIENLLASFERVAPGSRPELVLVSGDSGIGKSSVVNELHKVLVARRGLFASGKFDRYKRDIPYATLAQTFQDLIRPLLSKSEAELSKWRDVLREAVGLNGQLLVDLVPELKLIIGEPPPVPELPLQQAQQRFRLVFRRFVRAFATGEHPLSLFFDDLQWLDAATLDVLEDLLTQSDVGQVMLIGAYRDNEVDASHPLMCKLVSIRGAGVIVKEIALDSLTGEDLAQLVVDTFHCELERATPLARLIQQKTAGNPFFAIQFISALVDEGLVHFDYGEGRWVWDLSSIQAKGYTENVVDLMVGKLNRLPLETQNALQLLACVGNSADFALLEMVYQGSKEEMHDRLWQAVQAGVIVRTDHSYKFLHDRLQEAAYSLIPESSRAEAHLQIGRSLAAHTPPEMQEERIFEIVNQLNRSSHLINSTGERNELAELNLIAGRRAKSSTAYASALTYLAVGRVLLMNEAPRGRRILFSTLASHLPWSRAWAQNYGLIFSIEYLMAECELLTANMVVAEDRLSMLAQCAKSGHDVAAVTRLRLTLYTTLDRSDRAVEVCLEYLRRGGTDWSPRPTSDEVQREYDRIWSQLENREIEEFIDAPLMTNPDVLDALEVLAEVVTPALFCDERLSSLVICRMVNLSLEHGNSDASCFAYVWFAIIAGPRFGNYEAAFRFGQLGYDLVEKRGLKRFQARTYMSFGDIVLPWQKHVRAGRDLIRRAFHAANEIGDLTFAGYCCDHLVKNMLAAGDPLVEVQREAGRGLGFAEKVRFGLVVDHIKAQLGLVRTLCGLTPKFGSFDDEQFEEHRFEQYLASNPALAELECWYWVRKLQARFFAGDYISAIDASLNAQRRLWTSPSQFEVAELHFYGALSHAALWDSAAPDKKSVHFDALAVHLRQLEIWAEHCPENFETRAALVKAEMERIEGHDLNSMHLYELAIRSAHENGFNHNEAIAHELAARFYAARGFNRIADSYLEEAREGYVRWGAHGKVRQLEQLYPHLRQQEARSLGGTIGAAGDHLDSATFLKVSQAVSGEIVLEKLIDTLLRTAVELAGAQRGLLILPQGADLLVQAEATTAGNSVHISFASRQVSSAEVPEQVVQYAARSHEAVILDDAWHQGSFSEDEYIRGRRARSILCLPLIKQRKVVALLYLENGLAPGVFTARRLAALNVLASAAAISLENGRLYRELQEREAKIGRLVDANIVGILMWHVEGQILEANDAFLRIVGYPREDLVAGRLRWTDLTPQEWRERDEHALADLRAVGSAQPFEKEYFRKDGSRVPVLVAGALVEDGGHEGIAFVLDLSEQKRAEETLREQANLLSLTHDAIFVCDMNGILKYWNRGAQELYGWTAQEAMGKVTHGLLRTIFPTPLGEIVSEVVRAGRWEGELVHAKKDGSQIVVSSRWSLQRDEKGLPVGYLETNNDITERKQEESARRNMEESHRLVVETANDAIVNMDESGVIVFANPATIRIFGYDPAELIGKQLTVLMPEFMRKLHDAGFKRYMATGQRHLNWQGTELTALRKNGEEFPVALSFGELARDGHKVFTGFIRDITEQKRAEEALRRSENYLAQAQRLAHIGTWAFDALRQQPLYLSEEWYRLYEFDPKDGMPSWEQRQLRVHPEDRVKMQAAVDRALSEKSELDVEFRILPPHSTARWLRSIGQPVFGQAGEVTQLVGVTMDVTESRQAEQERERLRRTQAELAHINRVSTLGELTASLAHEIKQPIGAAVTNAEACFRLLDRDKPDVPEAREAAVEMVKDARRAAAIIDRVRSLYRKGSSELDAVDVNEIISEMVVMLQNEASQHSVTIQTDLTDGLPKAMADRVQLQQALMNLMLNGIEAMQASSGELRVKSRLADDGQLLISVADTGVGLPDENVNKIFDAFFTTKSQGTGLGLAITRSIVKSHGGRIWATANSGRGATFHFTLPSTVAAAA